MNFYKASASNCVRNHKRRNAESGFSLVELMIAMLLGLLLTAVVITSFLSTKRTYGATNNLNLIQENARFSMHFLSKAIRDSGNLGCINRVRNKLNNTTLFNLNAPITGYEAQDTGAGDTVRPANTPATATIGWNQFLPDTIRGRAVADTDILVLNSVEKLNVTLANTNSKNSSTLTVLTPTTHGVSDGAVLLAGDCVQSELFKHSGNASHFVAQTGAGASDNRELGSVHWGRDYGSESSVYQAYKTYYYVGIGAGGDASLFRLVDDLNPNTTDVAEELVEGVESLQLFYGVDTDGDFTANVYLDAGGASGDWENVVGVRLGLLMKSPNNSNSVDYASTGGWQLLGTVTIVMANPDNILRYVTSSTVKPRNRGLIESYSVCTADIADCNLL